MKKIIALLLVAVMTVMAIPCTGFAADTFEKGDPNTFWGILYTASVSNDHLVKSVNVRLKYLEEKGAVALAKELATQLKQLPEGRRVLDITGFTMGLTAKYQNYFFLNDESVAKVKGDVDALFSALKNVGAEIDYVIDDNESTLVCYLIENIAISKFRDDGENIDQTIANKGHLYEDWIKEELIRVESLPEYQNELKPLLEKYGYVFGKEYDLEYINIFPGAQEPRRTKFYESNPPEGADTAYSVFNYVLESKMFYSAYDDAVFKTIWKYYPDVNGTNYGVHSNTGILPVYNYQGGKFAPGTDGASAGNAVSPINYGSLKMIETNPPAEYPFDTFPNTAYNQLMIEMVKINDIVISKGDRHFMPWIGSRSWVDSLASAAYHNHYNTDYYQELVFHCGMYNADPFLVYNQDAETPGDDMIILSKAFEQLGELVGFEDRKPIIPTLNQALSWDQRYILSGMTANGKGVWRITPDLYTPGVSMENFLVSTANGVKFRIGNQCVDFPAGSYIYEPEEKVSEYGYWVITPDGTWPNEYRDPNLYLPDIPADTAEDHKPEGYKFESSETLPDPDNYLKTTYTEDGKVNTGASKPSTDEPKGDEPQTDKPSEPVKKPATTLVLKPIMGGGKTSLYKGAMPADMVGHWAQDSLANMMGIGVMQGTGSGMVPDRMINKAEFLAMLMRILGVQTTAYEGGYSDVAVGSWYGDIVSTAAAGGWIDAVGDTLSPESDLTRGKMCVILVNALGIEAENGDSAFDDISFLSDDTQAAIKTVEKLGLIKGYPDGTFKPNNVCTRAETAVVFERILLLVPELFGDK